MDQLSSCLHPNPGWDMSETQESKNYIFENTNKMIGKHCILELYQCDKNKLNDEAFVRTTVTIAARIAGATLLNMITHRFNPQGITGLALLAESHISIHTWPELGYAAVDVFTCGEHTIPEKACEFLAKEFVASNRSLKKLQRETPNGLNGSNQRDPWINSIDSL